MTETKVVTYKSERSMRSGIIKQYKKGWGVISTDTLDRGRSIAKTGCLGLIFLPLALLGKRKSGFMVTYQKEGI